MDFEYLIRSLNEHNIKQLIFLLKHSSCKKCKFIYEKICNGENLFDILYIVVDDIGKTILKPKNIYCLNILGDYLVYKREFNKSLKQALYYPIFITISVNIIFFVLNYMIKVDTHILYIELVIFPAITGVYLFMKSQYKKYMKILLLKLLMHNQISFNDFKEVIGSIDKSLDLHNLKSIMDLSEKVLGYTCVHTEEINVVYNHFLEDNPRTLRNACFLVNNFILVLASVIIILTFYNLFTNFHMKLSI